VLKHARVKLNNPLLYSQYLTLGLEKTKGPVVGMEARKAYKGQRVKDKL
jgi:hypothetical protein